VADIIKSNRDKILALSANIRRNDPRLSDIIDLLADNLHEVIVTVSPIISLVTTITGPTGLPGAITSVTITLTRTAIQITWSSVASAQLYEIREGEVWETAVFILRTPSLGAALAPRVPAPLIDGYHFLIKSINALGVESTTAFAFSVLIPLMGMPSISSQVIDNNVLLFWTIPFSIFQIDHYNVYKDNVKFAEISGTFITRFEAASGTYLYQVEAVDIAGQLSARGSTSATVRQPPDYNLLLEFESDFTGTLVNCIREITDLKRLIACVDTTETYQNHFINGPGGPWVDPEDQVTAGFERFIQENLLTGSYQDQIDYGAVIQNIIVNVTYVKEQFTGTTDVTVVVKMDSSLNGTVWTGEVVGVSQFFPAFRYLRIKMEFTAPNSDSMIAISSFKAAINVKREMDSGTVSVLASDTTGTQVNFTKPFRDVDSVTGEAQSTEPVDVVVDFVDIPDPVGFKLFAFNGFGQRVDSQVYWKARGIV